MGQEGTGALQPHGEKSGWQGAAYLFVPQDLEEVVGREAPRLKQKFPRLLQAGPGQHQQLVRGGIQQEVPELGRVQGPS